MFSSPTNGHNRRRARYGRQKVDTLGRDWRRDYGDFHQHGGGKQEPVAAVR